MNRKYGYIKDEPDSRDLIWTHLYKVLPPSVDMRSLVSPVRDQGEQGSCTGFGNASLREFWEKKNSTVRKLFSINFQIMSPRWIYFQERVLEHTVNEDSGANIRDGLKQMVNLGCAPEVDCKYDVEKFADKPSIIATTHALKYRIPAYFRISSLDQLKTCIAGGNTAVMGFEVYASFEEDAIAKTGIMPMPASGEKLLGGHCVHVVGYKDSPVYPGGGCAIVKNSWGKLWGDKGYFYMPYAYFKSYLVVDMWAIL